MKRLGIVTQTGEANRDRVYCARELLNILEEPGQLGPAGRFPTFLWALHSDWPSSVFSARVSLVWRYHAPQNTLELMKEWPPLNDAGDLPPDIHPARLSDVIERFGRSSPSRAIVARRLERIYSLVHATGHLTRFIIFGSFITAKAAPNDVDIFLIMDDTFDVSKVTGETAVLFDHLAAQNYEGASIFWVRRVGALGGEQAAVEDWQLKRDGSRRGLVQVTAP